MGIRRKLLLVGAIALIAGACGGGPSAADSAASEPQQEADIAAGMPDADAGSDAEPSPSCAVTSGAFETADGSASLAPISALAARILDGEAYTIYIADRELNSDEVSLVRKPTAGPGETIVMIAITTFNAEGPIDPVVADEVVTYTPDFGTRTFRVVADVAGTSLGNSVGAEGTITVSSVEGRFCADLNYTDGEKSVTAVIDAEIVDI